PAGWNHTGHPWSQSTPVPLARERAKRLSHSARQPSVAISPRSRPVPLGPPNALAGKARPFHPRPDFRKCRFAGSGGVIAKRRVTAIVSGAELSQRNIIGSFQNSFANFFGRIDPRING